MGSLVTAIHSLHADVKLRGKFDRYVKLKGFSVTDDGITCFYKTALTPDGARNLLDLTESTWKSKNTIKQARASIFIPLNQCKQLIDWLANDYITIKSNLAIKTGIEEVKKTLQNGSSSGDPADTTIDIQQEVDDEIDDNQSDETNGDDSQDEEDPSKTDDNEIYENNEDQKNEADKDDTYNNETDKEEKGITKKETPNDTTSKDSNLLKLIDNIRQDIMKSHVMTIEYLMQSHISTVDKLISISNKIEKLL
jgi:hypothetical protein